MGNAAGAPRRAAAHTLQYMTDSNDTPQARQQARPHWMHPSLSPAWTTDLRHLHRVSIGGLPRCFV